jgi:hypothetical protein
VDVAAGGRRAREERVEVLLLAGAQCSARVVQLGDEADDLPEVARAW